MLGLVFLFLLLVRVILFFLFFFTAYKVQFVREGKC